VDLRFNVIVLEKSSRKLYNVGYIVIYSYAKANVLRVMLVGLSVCHNDTVSMLNQLKASRDELHVYPSMSSPKG